MIECFHTRCDSMFLGIFSLPKLPGSGNLQWNLYLFGYINFQALRNCLKFLANEVAISII